MTTQPKRANRRRESDEPGVPSSPYAIRHRWRPAIATPLANQVVNPLPVYVDLFWIGGASVPQYIQTVQPNQTATIATAPSSGQSLQASFDPTGATIAASGSYANGYTLGLALPNTLPLPPSTPALPVETAPVVVGAGVDSNGNLVTREQYWARASQSYALGPNETRTVAVTQVSGVTSTSSSLDTISLAVNGSVSGGWGPVSANISAGLNATSTVQHQVTLSDQITSSLIIEITSGDEPVLVLYWQLMDRILWWDDQSIDAVEYLGMLDVDDPPMFNLAGNLIPKASVLLGQLPLVPIVSTALESEVRGRGARDGRKRRQVRRREGKRP